MIESPFDKYPELLEELKRVLKEDINTPTEKIFWLPLFQQYKVSKQSISAKRKAFGRNPALLELPEVPKNVLKTPEKSTNRI